ncbi:MAG TPA: AbrB/MazE/SpoVT family DNA-binding domain-containing protein [Thermaerobacter sp.]
MDVRRILRIGRSLGVTLPARELRELGLGEGAPVEVQVDRVRRRVVIQPLAPATEVDPAFVEEARRFAEHHRSVLEQLAKR